MRHIVMTIKNRSLIIYAILTSISVISIAQDSTFLLTEAFTINPLENTFISKVYKFDLDNNYREELIVSLIDRDLDHRIGIFHGAERIQLSDQMGAQVKTIFFCDFNSDGNDDIVLETLPDQYLEVYYGPDYELSLNEPAYYMERISTGGERILPDGDTKPLAATSYFRSTMYEDEDSLYTEHVFEGKIWQGTWINERPEDLGVICKPVSFILRDNGDTGSDFFSAGYHEVDLQIHSDSVQIDRPFTRFSLYSSYTREFEHPDSVTIIELDADNEAGRPGQLFGFSEQSAVEDVDNDGHIDWIQAHWTREGENDFAIHLVKYDPDSLLVRGEYIEDVEDIEVPGIGQWPIPILGVSAIDINQDGVWELLLAIQGQPIRIIDSQSMELIMSSDVEIPNIVSWMFRVGYFERGNRLQAVIYDGRSLVAYNFPEEWDIPNSIEEQPWEKVKWSLMSNFPNPFNSTTTIVFNLMDEQYVSLQVFDLTGRLVDTLVDDRLSAGRFTSVWNADLHAAGVYFYRLQAGSFQQTKKLTLVK